MMPPPSNADFSVIADRKLPIEIFVIADPNPNPIIYLEPLGHCTIVPSHAHRPKAWVRAQPLETQRGMSWVVTKPRVNLPGCLADANRKSTISAPEVWRSPRLHGCSSKSALRISGNRSGFAFNSASILSPNAVRAGLGVGSLMMRSLTASPFNSGRMDGRWLTNLSLSSGGKARIASSISFAVLIALELNPRSAYRKSFKVRVS
jgi:hypothetical protein